MTLKELSQLYYLNREIEMDKERLERLDAEIKKDEEQIEYLEMRAQSAGGVNYDGMPKSPSYEDRLAMSIAKIVDLQTLVKKKKQIRSDCAMEIQAKQILCLTERNRLERYIADLPTSLLRMIFTYRFINGLTWAQVSDSIGVRTTEESVKKICYRYLEEQNALES